MEMKKEHERIIPMLRKGGYNKEAKRQQKELKKYK